MAALEGAKGDRPCRVVEAGREVEWRVRAGRTWTFVGPSCPCLCPCLCCKADSSTRTSTAQYSKSAYRELEVEGVWSPRQIISGSLEEVSFLSFFTS